MKTKRLVIDAMLIAIYYVLSSCLSANFDGIRITVDVLPVLVAAALYGPVDGMIVGFIGNFLFQLAGPYGISVTTVLWALPDAVRGLVVGLFLGKCRWNTLPFARICAALVGTSLIFTTLTTAVMYVDCLVYKYSFAAYTPFILIRYITGIVIAVVSAVILPPILKALSKNGKKYGGEAA